MSFQVTIRFSGVVLSIALPSRPCGPEGQHQGQRSLDSHVLGWLFVCSAHRCLGDGDNGQDRGSSARCGPRADQREGSGLRPILASAEVAWSSASFGRSSRAFPAAGAWKDHALLEMRKANLTRVDTDDVSRRALEVYAARAARTDMPMPSQKVLEHVGLQAGSRGGWTSLTVKHTRKWVPSAADIVLALENQAADELVSDIVSDDFGMAEQEEDGLPDKVSGKAEAIADLQAYAGYGNSALWYKKMSEVKIAQGFMEIAQGWGRRAGSLGCTQGSQGFVVEPGHHWCSRLPDQHYRWRDGDFVAVLPSR